MAELMMAKMDPQIRAKMELTIKAMSSINPQDVLHDFRPFLVVFKDGNLRRFFGTETIPAGVDPLTGVDSKDVVISPETGNFVRIYKPSNVNPQDNKLPLLVYFHGGGFCIETASSPTYQLYLNHLSSKANVVVVSVDYRLAPEFPVPIAYDDSWIAVRWIADEGAGDPWLDNHVDYSRVFFGGDSAGANIAHQMAMRLGKNPLPRIRLNGVVLIHPFFWGEERIGSEELKIKKGAGTVTGDELWKFVCPDTNGSDDPLINPEKDPDLLKFGGERVLVLVAEKDTLRDRGFHYKDALVKCGWKGVATVAEAMDEYHCFHLMNSTSSDTAREMMSRVVSFLNSTPDS